MENSTATVTAPKAPVQPATTGVQPKAPEKNPAQVGSKDSKLEKLRQITGQGPSTAQGEKPKSPESSGSVEGQATAPVQGETDPLLAELDQELGQGGDGYVDTVSSEMVGKPIMDKLSDAKFKIPYKKGFREITGIDQLYRLAALGMSSSENNQRAKQVIEDAQQFHNNFQKNELPSLVSQGIKDALGKKFEGFMRTLNSGTYLDGQRFKSPQEFQQAVASMEGFRRLLMDEAPSGPQAQQGSSIDPEKLEQQIREKLENEFREKNEQAQSQESAKRFAQETTRMMNEAIRPYAQKFQASDGKINQRRFDGYAQAVYRTAAQYADKLAYKYPDGFPSNVRQAIAKKAAKDVLSDFVDSKPEPSSESQPPMRGGSGSPAAAPGKGNQGKGSEKKPAFGTPAYFKWLRTRAS